jgi:hypothetical protein
VVAYRFEDCRGADCVARHLGGFSGILQVDSYSAYTNLAKARVKTGSNETIQLAGCWAHLRRKFYDLPISGVSQAATASIIAMTELWQIEDDVRGNTYLRTLLIHGARGMACRPSASEALDDTRSGLGPRRQDICRCSDLLRPSLALPLPPLRFGGPPGSLRSLR